MEDEIKILEEVCQRPIEETEGIKILRKAITNLINKYKEQKRDIRDNHILLAKYSQKNEEQEKVIELMIEYIKETDFITEDYCFRREDCENVGGNRMCKDCIIDYFKKKARTSSEL